MTTEELNQIRALIREEVAAAEKRLIERQDRAIGDLRKQFNLLGARGDLLSGFALKDPQGPGVFRLQDEMVKEWSAAHEQLFGQEGALTLLKARVKALEERSGVQAKVIAASVFV